MLFLQCFLQCFLQHPVQRSSNCCQCQGSFLKRGWAIALVTLLMVSANGLSVNGWGWCLPVLARPVLTDPVLALSFQSPVTPKDIEPQASIKDQFQKAFAATNGGDFEAAEGYWSAILEQDPNNAAAWSNRGNARISQNRVEAALEDYNQSVALAPNAPDPYINRGIAFEALGDWERAIADYNQAIAFAPEDPVAYNNRGNAKAGAGDWTGALADYRYAFEKSPGYAIAGANYALTLYQTQNTEAATRLVRTLVRKYPQFADMRAALTAILWAGGNRGEAESNWVSVLSLDPRYQDLEWVETIRRWPPVMVQALQQFLTLKK